MMHNSVKSVFPDAKNVRFEGECDSCHQYELWSLQNEHDYDRGYNEETCGYLCLACGFSNAGSREKYNFPDF